MSRWDYMADLSLWDLFCAALTLSLMVSLWLMAFAISAVALRCLSRALAELLE